MKKNLLEEEEDSEEEQVVIDLMTRTEDGSEVDLIPDAESDSSKEDKSNLEIDEVSSLFSPSELKASLSEMLKKFDAFLVKI